MATSSRPPRKSVSPAGSTTPGSLPTVAYCLREAGLDPRATRLRRLLRKAADQVRAPSGNLPGLRPARVSQLSPGHAALARRTSSTSPHAPPELGATRRAPVLFLDHHESHAASAFFPSPFDEAAILTLDGVGEWTHDRVGHGRRQPHSTDAHLRFPHSLGLLYSAFTYYCGFKVNSGEYKLMGLAPYGRPVVCRRDRRHLIDLKSDGSFRLDMRLFQLLPGPDDDRPALPRPVRRPAAPPESPLEQRHMDLAASIQAVTEEVVLRLGRARPRADRDAQSRPGGRSRPQLRGQRPTAA